jgi:membrane protein YqaA with SNARE-associated domain
MNLDQYLSGDLSLWGIFMSSLLGATLLPGGSEVVLISVLTLHPELFWPALAVGTLGNTLGGMISFGMGRMLPLQLENGNTAGRDRNVSRMRRYGPPALLLAWAPLIGDALCVAAGWLRLNPWQCTLFIAAGKFARYAAIAMVA